MSWKKRFRNAKLANKILLVYALFAGISCVISVLALQACLEIYDSKLYEKSLQELDFFIQQVDGSLETIENLSLSLALDSEVQKQLEIMEECEYMSREYMLKLYYLRQTISKELVTYPAIKNIIYTDGSEAMTKAGTDIGSAKGELNPEVIRTMLLKFRDAKGGYITRNPTKEYPYLLSGRDIRELKNTTLDYMGSLIFISDIAEIIGRKNDSLQVRRAMLYVYSEDGMIYQDAEREKPNLPSISREKGYEIISIGGKRYFMGFLKSAKTGWMYVNLFPYSEIFGQTMLVKYLLLMGFLILCVCVVFAMKKMTVIIIRPLDQLTKSMQIVENGDFKGAMQALDADMWNDETGLLAQDFRVMLEKIDTLIYENYEKQLLLIDTKYKMLQAQINPHFLYNTLSTVNWMVKGRKNDDAGKVILELGKLLRASLAKEPYTTVADELETAKGYMVIQKYRYQHRIEFLVEAEGELDNYMIPRMILQPLVENAVSYGVEESIDVCTVAVKAVEEEKAVVLEIADDGMGMDLATLDSVRAGTALSKGLGIGIRNIQERLKIAYEDSRFQIDSKPGAGTRICIRIPKVKAEDYHV